MVCAWLLLTLQTTAVSQAATTRAAAPASPSTTTFATRATRPPVIDGRDDDEIWRDVTPVSAFREFQPREDGPPRFATEFKTAYDARNIYVFVRAFDPHPDSILQLLGRRDARTASDQIKVVIDSYHDRRSGFEFAVNPAGVKRDYAIYNDNQEDDAWDGVWEAGTSVDSLGWTAEFRIPLSQLRYTPGDTNTFGFAIWRDIQRFTERVSWPVYRISRPGFAAQLGDLTGLAGLASPRRLEVSPYAVAKNAPVASPGGGVDRHQQWTGGADIKYGLTSNLTLDATVNPDFGQVEADPSVLNLSAFEPFFQERRPFFVAGTGIFRFNVDCSQVNCSGERLFYSRRIGRAPELSGLYGDENSPTATTILGAGKLTGRFPGGLTLGLLEATTDRARGAAPGTTIAPASNFAVLRAQQDYRAGQSGVGAMLTAVNRDLDPSSAPYLARTAYVGAVDFRHRFGGGRYQLSGSVDVSRVAGDAAAIARTQLGPVHYYQRPDGALRFDPTRTTLSGDAEEILFGKVGGAVTNFETSYLRRSPGFEVNDLGFLLRADQQSWNNWFGIHSTHPRGFYQQAFWNFNWWQTWSDAGLPTEHAFNTNTHVQLNNRWFVHSGVTLGQLGTTFCDRCARGGPALRVDPYVNAWGEIDGDGRPRLVPAVFWNYVLRDGGRSPEVFVNANVTVRLAPQLSSSVSLNYDRNRSNTQWYRNFTDSVGALHYTFAYLSQRTTSLSWRVDYTLSTTLTLQVYAQPFISKGTYANIREVTSPRAAAYADRYRPYGDTAVTNHPAGFNVKDFNSNVVLRWEYRPGSALFVVWTQRRDGFVPAEGAASYGTELHDLFDLYPKNLFLVKASYWMNW
jgi:uncharacterized protein DUF5916/cellulose/xylan binding protein with CBM9 domain